ncbi:MAG: class I SAM-dependent methyltransferase [Armatimonadota bacterium]
MKMIPAWQFNEFKHVGVDYADPAVAEKYDAQHARFRGKPAAESNPLLDWLGVQSGQSMIDMGCGTGSFAIQAAQRGAKVYAADVSPAMLAIAECKAQAAGVTGITFAQGGFLTYEHPDEPVDFITSTAALHHLPDFWKLTGLQRIAGMLKDDGRFCLMDSVYSFDPSGHARLFEEKAAWFDAQVDASFARDVATSYRDEFGTYDWIMEGLLSRAGFVIEQAQYPDVMWARYLCTKRK